MVEDNIKGKIKGNVKAAKALTGEVFRTIVDTFGGNIKEVYFVFNMVCGEETCFERVVASKNPDGELTLLIY